LQENVGKNLIGGRKFCFLGGKWGDVVGKWKDIGVWEEKWLIIMGVLGEFVNL